MSEKPDKELLHGALDGELTESDAVRLRHRLAADPQAQAEAERLQHLQDVLRQAGPAEPPDGLPDRVMAMIAVRDAQREARTTAAAAESDTPLRQLRSWVACHFFGSTASGRPLGVSGMNGGGAIVAKKTLWAVAGVAVVAILAFVYFNGTRSVDQGVEGTIAGANRAVGAQPASVNVATGDVQAFLQSDTFNKILKNKELRNLLMNPATCAILGDVAVQNALTKASLQTALDDAAVEAAFHRLNLQLALEDEKAQAAFADAEVEAQLRAVPLQSALRTKEIKALMGDREALAYMMDAEVMEALKDGTKAAALRKEAEAALGKQTAVRAASMRENAKLNHAMSNLAFASVIARVPEAQLQAYVKFVSLAPVKAAMQGNGPMAAMFTDDVVLAAFHGDKGGLAYILGDPEFMTAVKAANTALIQAGLAQVNAQGKAAMREATEQANAQAKAAMHDATEQANAQGKAAVREAQASMRQASMSFAALYANAAIQAAMRDGTLSAMFKPDGKAALKDVGRLQSALRQAQ
jgi:anti-sigma factor RsiW